MITIDDAKNNLLSKFSNVQDWESRYRIIIEMGKNLKSMPDQMKIDSNLIKGCQSQVWIFARLSSDQNRVEYFADSDALIVKGLVALLLDVFDQKTPIEIMNCSLDFIEQLGLKHHLTPSRANGLVSMVQQIKNFAVAFYYLKNKKS